VRHLTVLEQCHASGCRVGAGAEGLEPARIDEGEFGLFVWSDEDCNWYKIGEFPTLRAAKAVGRILAAKALENI